MLTAAHKLTSQDDNFINYEYITTTATDSTDTSTYTFSSVSLGSPTGKLVLVFVHAESANTVLNLNSVTVGGSSASNAITGGADFASKTTVGCWQISGVTSSTVNIVVTFSNTCIACAVTVVLLSNYESATYRDYRASEDSLSSTGNSVDSYFQILAGGVGFCMATVSSDVAVTWNGPTELYDISNATDGSRWTMAIFDPIATDRLGIATCNTTHTSAANGSSLLCISWR